MKGKEEPEEELGERDDGRERVASWHAALISVAASSILGLGLQRKKKWGFKGNNTSKTERTRESKNENKKKNKNKKKDKKEEKRKTLEREGKMKEERQLKDEEGDTGIDYETKSLTFSFKTEGSSKIKN